MDENKAEPVSGDEKVLPQTDTDQGRRRKVKRSRYRAAIMAASMVVLVVFCYCTMIRMPGDSYHGPLSQLTAEQQTLRDELRRDVEMLATTIGERNWYERDAYADAADYIEASLKAAGCQTSRQEFDVNKVTCCNVIGEVRGTKLPDEIIVVGAHYDSVAGTVGANDNGSGVAATLALARRFAHEPRARTVRFMAFANEEPPFFETSGMGSRVYAAACRERAETIVAMLSLETIGYYTDREGTQKYPFPLSLVYPSTGNFIAFVGNVSSRKLVRRTIAAFRKRAKFPSEGAALPSFIPGVGWSDHQAFWRVGYPAIMITDTAPFRYPHYHTPMDTADKIDFDRLALVVTGLRLVGADLADGVSEGAPLDTPTDM